MSISTAVGNQVQSSPKELFLRYYSFVFWYILALAITIGLGTMYIRYSTPKFRASTRILVKSDQQSGASRGGTDVVDFALIGGKKVNIDNEIEMMRSTTLMQRVVRNNNFNVSYHQIGSVRVFELFDESGFEMEVLDKKDSTTPIRLQLTNLTAKGFYVAPYKAKQAKSVFVPWRDTVHLANAKLVFKNKINSKFNNTYPFLVQWEPVALSVARLLSAMSIAPLGTKTTIISAGIIGNNPRKCAAILDAFVREYQVVNIEDKNKIASLTIDFINQRLNFVSNELEGVETNATNLKQKFNISDAGRQVDLLLTNYNSTDQELIKLGVKKNIALSLQQYLQNATNKRKLVPSNVGIEDASIAAMVANFNLLQLRREREAPLQTSKSLVLADIDNQLDDLRSSLLIALDNNVATINQQISEAERRNLLLQRSIAGIPEKESSLKKVNRQLSVKEALFVFLYSKREETAITAAATYSSFQQIDPAVYSTKPFEPDAGKVRLFCIVVGLIIPSIFIYLYYLFDDKIKSKQDITDKTTLPFIGEIGHNNDKNNLVVQLSDRSVLAEQFRTLRSNVQFLAGVDAKVLLITSTMSGEGKSFVSLNVAAAYAVSGKKVALLEFDLRRPRILSQLNIQRSEGLVNYLAEQLSNLEMLKHSVEGYPSLHVYGSGPIPPNPSELLLGKSIETMFAWLRANYDMVIVDSAPVGLVADSQTISKYSDACLYIIRQRYSYKNQLAFINDIANDNKLKNMGIVLNDVKVGGRYGYYGYTSTYGYGSGYGYGYNAYGEIPMTTWQKIKKKIGIGKK